MPFQSRWQIEIARSSLPTFLFGSVAEALDESKPLFLDAARVEECFLTPSAFRLCCQRLALGLRRSGSFEQGDRVLLFSGNDVYYPVVFLGTVMAGGIFTGANPDYVPRELAYQLRDSDAKYLFSAQSSLSTAVEAAKLIGMPLERVFVFEGAQRNHDDPVTPPPAADATTLRSWTELLAPAVEAKNFQWDDPQFCPDAWHRTLALNYSSGTTGHPKGVEITHANYVSQLHQYLHINALTEHSQKYVTQARWLNFLPLYHAMSQALNIGLAMKYGVSVYVMPKFDFVKMLEYVQAYKISHLTLAPPIVVGLVKSPLVKKFDLSSVEIAAAGAAPLGSEMTKEFNKLWPPGQMNLIQGWGMTELTCSVLAWDVNDLSLSHSVGELLPNCEAMIVPPDHRGNDEASAGGGGDGRDGSHDSHQPAKFAEITTMGPSSCGELWVRGPNVMKGYWRNAEATRQTLTQNGWLKTGDIAHINREDAVPNSKMMPPEQQQSSSPQQSPRPQRNRFYIVDRIKEVIKVKGFQVAPAEIEALLLNHPAVMDVAVVGYPHAISGSVGSVVSQEAAPSVGESAEKPTAYVVLRPVYHHRIMHHNDDDDKDDSTRQQRDQQRQEVAHEIIQYVADRTVKYKHLTGGVVFVDTIPKNPNGKILRRLLKESSGSAEAEEGELRGAKL